MKVTIVYEKMNLAINKIDEVENQFNDIHDKQLENIATSLQDYSEEHSNCFDDSLNRIDEFKRFISSLQGKLNTLQYRCKEINNSFYDSENNQFKNNSATRDSLKQALKDASIEVKDDDKIDAELQHQWLSPEDAIREGYPGENLLTEKEFKGRYPDGNYEDYLNNKREEWKREKEIQKYLNKENLLTEEEYKRRNPDGNYEDYLNQKVDEAKKQQIAKEFAPKNYLSPSFQESIEEKKIKETSQKIINGAGTLLAGVGEEIKGKVEELGENGKKITQKLQEEIADAKEKQEMREYYKTKQQLTEEKYKDKYVVQEGDNLYKIAREQLGDESRYKEIAQLNRIDGTNINPRDIIKLPGADEHIVTAGDNIFKIAREKLGDESRWQEIAELNGLNAENGYEINPGQSLKMPTDNTYDTLQQQLKDINDIDSMIKSNIATYSVQSGDSLYKIAREQLGDESRWQEIAELNGLNAENGYVINVDQKLKLPDKK